MRDDKSQIRIAALLTCHNRREKTVECLRALRGQASPILNFEFAMSDARSIQNPKSNIPPPVLSDAIQNPKSKIQNQKTSILIEVFLVDDGSTDGTADAVREVWPEATIIQGDGSLFWCGGMRVAWAEAAKTDPDYYLLLNDDTIIEPNAISVLHQMAPLPDQDTICVAPIADPESGEVVFGGHRGHEAAPLKPAGKPIACDTMNANCTLVTRAVYRRIGMFHRAYTHAMGDFDYGFAAARAGITILQAGHVLGTSKPNPEIRTWRDKSLPRGERFRLLWFSPKGLPFWEWATYTRRNTGPLWPYRAISPALRILAGK